MKKILLTSLVFINLIFAGLIDGLGFYGGLTRVGVTLDSDFNLDSDMPFENNLVTGYTLGVRMNVGPLAIGVGHAPRYVELFAEASENTGTEIIDIEATTEMSWNFIEIWSVLPVKVGPVSLWAGGSLGIPYGDGHYEDEYLATGSGSHDYEGDEFDLKNECDYEEGVDDVADACEEFHFGTDYGILFGVSYPIGPNIAVSIGYNYGLNQIIDWEAFEDYDSDDEDEDWGTWNSMFVTFTFKL